jgi:uncharacterized membrane protein
MACRHGVIEAGAEGDFDPLDGVEDKQTEVAVELIKIDEVQEPGAGMVMIGQLPIAIANSELEAVS